METVYQVPLLLQEQGLLKLLRKGLELDKLQIAPERTTKGATLFELWKKIVNVPKDFPPVEIALVGKYTQHMDSYLSTVSHFASVSPALSTNNHRSKRWSTRPCGAAAS